MTRARPESTFPKALPALVLACALALPLAGCSGEDGEGGEAAQSADAKKGPPAAAAKGRGGWPGAGGREGGFGRPAVPVRVEPVDSRDIRSIYRTSATVRAAARAPVVARAGGIIRRILAEEGDRVSKGQLLAQLEDDQVKLEREQAEVDLQIAEREFERAERLRDENLTSIEEYEQKRNSLTQAVTRLDIAELNVSFTLLTAPFDGIVTSRLLDPGATVASGEEVFELVDVSRFYVDVPVPEQIAATLVPGAEAVLRPTALDRELSARVERLSPDVDPQTGTVKATLVTDPVDGLRTGAFVEVRITTQVHEDALVVASDALVSDGQGWAVFTVEDGKARRIAIETGFEDESGVEIIPLGDGPSIDGGTMVVVSGVAALADGAPVRVDRPEEEKDGATKADSGTAVANGKPSGGATRGSRP